jgi:hypothetical protein
MERVCPVCNEIIMEGKNFCPNCGYKLSSLGKRTGKPIAGGILLLIAACFCFAAAIFSLFRMIGIFYYGFGGPFLLIIVIFLIWGFSIGLAGGIFSLKRKNFPVALLGASFVLVAGCLDFFGTIVLGFVILILAILSTIFIAISKNEFLMK